MDLDSHKDKDHSLFISLLAARIATFSNQMVQYLIKVMHDGPEKKIEKKNNEEEEEQSHSDKSSEIVKMQKEDERKRKYFKVRNRLPIDTDGDRPKAPTSSFLIYYHDKKHDLAKKFGETNVSKLTKLASLQWKNLAENERSKYQKISDGSKERYQKEMHVYKIKYADKIEQALKKRRVEYRNNWLNKKKAQQAKQKGDQSLSINDSLQFSDEQEAE